MTAIARVETFRPIGATGTIPTDRRKKLLDAR